MSKIFKKIKYKNLIYVFFCIYIIVSGLLLDCSYILMHDNLTKVINIINIICYLFFAFNVVKEYIEGSKITWNILVLGILSVIIFLFSKNINIFCYLVVLVSLRNCNINKLLNIAFKTYLYTFLIIVSLSLLGIIPNWLYSVTLELDQNRIRYCLGFISPTDAHNYLIIISLLFFYIKRNHFTFLEIFLLEVLNIFIYSNTVARTGFLVVTLICIIMILFKFKLFNRILKNIYVDKIIKCISYSLPALICILFMSLVCLYNKNIDIGLRVNNIISGRLYLTDLAIQKYGVSLFGEDIYWYGWGGYGYIFEEDKEDFQYNYVDTSYSRIMFDYGIIMLIIVLYGYTKLLRKSYKNKDYILMSIIFLILIWSFMEPNLIDLRKNILILLFIPYLEYNEIKCLSFNKIKKIFS